ncbi:4592_t:CDS:2 [Paraglomus brasilianum]|uniref:4592_t:CDS:1 n=1 Tax=Paraglomus brasilianum TaxID=144538 RepID=A0A9N9D9M8_9GLOM|nr:4592_t:CDS:2 [Paraglomus brasilianum]
MKTIPRRVKRTNVAPREENNNEQTQAPTPPLSAELQKTLNNLDRKQRKVYNAMPTHELRVGFLEAILDEKKKGELNVNVIVLTIVMLVAVERWHKGQRPTRPMPKDRTKLFF